MITPNATEPESSSARMVSVNKSVRSLSHIITAATSTLNPTSIVCTLVHHLDVGGIPVAEGPGLSTIMAGARALQKDDDALLTAMTPVLDSLYAGYAGESAKK